MYSFEIVGASSTSDTSTGLILRGKHHGKFFGGQKVTVHTPNGDFDAWTSGVETEPTGSNQMTGLILSGLEDADLSNLKGAMLRAPKFSSIMREAARSVFTRVQDRADIGVSVPCDDQDCWVINQPSFFERSNTVVVPNCRNSKFIVLRIDGASPLPRFIVDAMLVDPKGGTCDFNKWTEIQTGDETYRLTWGTYEPLADLASRIYYDSRSVGKRDHHWMAWINAFPVVDEPRAKKEDLLVMEWLMTHAFAYLNSWFHDGAEVYTRKPFTWDAARELIQTQMDHYKTSVGGSKALKSRHIDLIQAIGDSCYVNELLMCEDI